MIPLGCAAFSDFAHLLGCVLLASTSPDSTEVTDVAQHMRVVDLGGGTVGMWWIPANAWFRTSLVMASPMGASWVNTPEGYIESPALPALSQLDLSLTCRIVFALQTDGRGGLTVTSDQQDSPVRLRPRLQGQTLVCHVWRVGRRSVSVMKVHFRTGKVSLVRPAFGRSTRHIWTEGSPSDEASVPAGRDSAAVQRRVPG